MERRHSIENAVDNGKLHRLNSPRSLEACLRAGIDPSELVPKSRKHFNAKGLTPTMVDMKYEMFNTKRFEKINLIKEERNKIILYKERKLAFADSAPPELTTTTTIEIPEQEKISSILQTEEKRMEALKRRQEKDLAKTVEREHAAVRLQMKIKQAEEEEIKKQKLHAKKVVELKKAEDKKRQEMAAEEKRKEAEDEAAKKLLAKKEAAIAEKITKNRFALELRLQKEARERDEERKMKMEEYARQTAALLKVQEAIGEANKIKMYAREKRIQDQLQEKKEQKRKQVQVARDKVAVRIAEALEKHHELHEQRKAAFAAAEAKRIPLQKEKALFEKERLRKQADDREKKHMTRHSQLIDSYNNRKERREVIVQERVEKDRVFDKIARETAERQKMMKFTAELKLAEKVENVERVGRQMEFKKLQTLQNIYRADHKYDDIIGQKKEMQLKQKQAAKMSLIRKHEIADAMEMMKMTNDYSILDKLFSKKKIEIKKHVDEDEKDDPRLAQTM